MADLLVGTLQDALLDARRNPHVRIPPPAAADAARQLGARQPHLPHGGAPLGSHLGLLSRLYRCFLLPVPLLPAGLGIF